MGQEKERKAIQNAGTLSGTSLQMVMGQRREYQENGRRAWDIRQHPFHGRERSVRRHIVK